MMSLVNFFEWVIISVVLDISENSSSPLFTMDSIHFDVDNFLESYRSSVYVLATNVHT